MREAGDKWREPRWLAAAGAVSCALAVGGAAYAAHAPLAPELRSRLLLAAVFAFGHGLALAALAPRMQGRLAWTALLAMAVGVSLFSGSLTANALAGASTAAAPAGGLLMIAGWLLHAAAALRGRGGS